MAASTQPVPCEDVANDKRIAVLLLQLGGPKTIGDIVPFLTELFADVLPLPAFLARPLGRFIAKRRIHEVTPLYEEIGGGSPLLRHTERQGALIKEGLARRGIDAEVLIGMRYAPPRLDAALTAFRKMPKDTPLVVLPLYPQYSFATTRSSLIELNEQLKVEERKRLFVINAYPDNPAYLEAMADSVAEHLPTHKDEIEEARLVFSAHGLPMSLVRKGDPYPQHIEQTMKGTLRILRERGFSLPKHILCFQSRVGPVKWLTPATEDTLIELGKEGVKRVVVVPIAFVSEHIETLHELDIQLRETAKEAGVEQFARAETVMFRPSFVKALCDEVQAVLA